MNQKQISTIKKHLTVKDGQIMTTSLDLANFFDKKHKHILEAVINLGCPSDFTGPNFRPSTYKDPTNRSLPMLEITRKGFVLLAMGFTGERAMEFKIAYLEAFDLMEAELRQGAVTQQTLVAELLAMNPLWRDLKRYKQMGLRQFEICKLVALSKDTVRKNIRRMEACGIIAPPSNLAKMQVMSRQFLLPGMEVR